MSVGAFVLTAALAGVFLWAGLEKARSRKSFRQTLEALGFNHSARLLMSIVVPFTELAAALGLILFPAATWPRLVVAGLAVGFAGAGVLALRAAQPVTCSCFGSTSGGFLGWRQVLLLPVWLAAVAGLYWLRPDWSFSTGVQYLAALVVLIGAVHGVSTVRAWRAATGNRLAIEEAIVLRRPILLFPEEVEAS